MLALTATGRPGQVDLAEVADPRALPSEALVDVRAMSLNRGEVQRLETMEPGTITGWDVAGTVARAADDGSGPPAGARVVGVTYPPRGWAQQAAIPTSVLAALPDGVSFEQAACLPVAGLTALRALEHIGFVLGRTVAVTGASGGVGRLAVQLARDAGAHVVAVARRTAGLAELGAAEVVTELTLEGPPLHGVLDGVGGPVLGAAIQRVATDGTIVSYASTVPEPVSYPTRALFGRAPGAQVRGLFIFHELATGFDGTEALGRLARRVADGHLDVGIAHTASWREADDAIAALLDGRVAGKAVLTVD